jgi:hypothetical protein
VALIFMAQKLFFFYLSAPHLLITIQCSYHLLKPMREVMTKNWPVTALGSQGVFGAKGVGSKNKKITWFILIFAPTVIKIRDALLVLCAGS